MLFGSDDYTKFFMFNKAQLLQVLYEQSPAPSHFAGAFSWQQEVSASLFPSEFALNGAPSENARTSPLVDQAHLPEEIVSSKNTLWQILPWIYGLGVLLMAARLFGTGI